MGPPWQKTTRGGARPDRAHRPGGGRLVDQPGDRAGRRRRHERAGRTHLGRRQWRRRRGGAEHPGRRRPVQVDLVDGRPLGGVLPRTASRPVVAATATPAMATHGCSTGSDRQPGEGRPSAVGGTRRTRWSRPSRRMRLTTEPSGHSAMVAWPSTQSGAWNSRLRRHQWRRRRIGAVEVGLADPVAAATTRSVRPPGADRRPGTERGWPTEHCPPPATRWASVTDSPEPDSPRVATHSSETSHGMFGCSQVIQASRRRPGRRGGAATNSPASTSGTVRCEPSVATPTSRCPAPSAPTRSSTHTSQAPEAVVRGPPIGPNRPGPTPGSAAPAGRDRPAPSGRGAGRPGPRRRGPRTR